MQKNVLDQWQGNKARAVVVSALEAEGTPTPLNTLDGNPRGSEGELCFLSSPHIIPGLRGSYGQGSGLKNYRTFLYNGNVPLGSANSALLTA